MKYGKEFMSQMVLEWQEAYMNYSHLKSILKDILKIQQMNKPPHHISTKAVLYRAFSGITRTFEHGFPHVHEEREDEIILVRVEDEEGGEGGGSQGIYQTSFLGTSDKGGELELEFFRRLDDEFNKVIRFYKAKVEEVMEEAAMLDKQMDALVALRFNLHYPNATASCPISASGSLNTEEITEMPHMDVIQEVEMSEEMDSDDSVRRSTTSGRERAFDDDEDEGDREDLDYKAASMEVLNNVKINVARATLMSTMKNVWKSSESDFGFSKVELRSVERLMKKAFIVCHHKLCSLKNYCFTNQMAFSKIMKKYDKITSRKASKVYLEMVEKSYLGYSDEVAKLIDRIESTFTKHFADGDRRKGMNSLRPHVKRDKHRVTFFSGVFLGCSVALVVGIILAIHTRNVLNHEEGIQFMGTAFPLYSLFGFIVLHMLLYAGNIYYWKRFRVNYSFIFGVKPGVVLGFREVLFLSSALAVLTLVAVITNLEMDIDQSTENFSAIAELVPAGLVIVTLSIFFCPFNIFYSANRFFIIQCIWHCVCAPFYKVTLSDFFLADQLTSQVQSFRSLEFYICYYGWGDFEHRSHQCGQTRPFQIVSIIVAIIPFTVRFLQCLRRTFEERDSMQAWNGLKYFSIIVAVVIRTYYEQRGGMSLRIMTAVTSAVAAIFATYWDLVWDWGLLCKDSKNPWLRDKLLVPNKFVYFVAMVLNVVLRFAWMQTVLGIYGSPTSLHRNAVIAIMASLEIIRRGVWNFFRLENEHLNNVGKYRAFKTVPLPFSYEEEDRSR